MQGAIFTPLFLSAQPVKGQTRQQPCGRRITIHPVLIYPQKIPFVKTFWLLSRDFLRKVHKRNFHGEKVRGGYYIYINLKAPCPFSATPSCVGRPRSPFVGLNTTPPGASLIAQPPHQPDYCPSLVRLLRHVVLVQQTYTTTILYTSYEYVKLLRLTYTTVITYTTNITPTNTTTPDLNNTTILYIKLTRNSTTEA